MKNLIKHSIKAYLILWMSQVAVSLPLMLFFDVSSSSGMVLIIVIPVIFLLINITLCERLFGLASKRREKFNMLYPGSRIVINFFRYILPIISLFIPYLLISLVYLSGLYWKIQHEVFMWPRIEGINTAFATGQLYVPLYITLFLFLILAFYMVEAVSNIKRKKMIFIRIVVIYLCLLIFNFKFNNSDLTYNSEIILLIQYAILFFWFTYFKPERPRELFSKKNINYWLFIAFFLFMFVKPTSIKSFTIYSRLYYIAIVVAIYSLRAGWRGALIGGICGLNIISAIWWLLCIPVSTICRCKNCGATTVTCNMKCPRCKTPQNYEAIKIFQQIKNRVRPGFMVLALISFILFINYVVLNNNLIRSDNHKKNGYIINTYSSINNSLTNIVIVYNGEIVGTNKTNTKIDFQESDVEYYCRGEELTVISISYAGSNVYVHLRSTSNITYVDNIVTKILYYDYDIADKINKEFQLNETDLIDLAYFIKISPVRNKSLYKCYAEIFSNYWHSLTPTEQKEKFMFYFSKSDIPTLFLLMIAKNSSPEWFKGSTAMPYIPIRNRRIRHIFNESQVKRLLFFSPYLGVSRMTTIYNLVSPSETIKKIVENYNARKKFTLSFIDNKIPKSFVVNYRYALPYYRKYYKNEKIKFQYYLLTLINQKKYNTNDLEIIKYLIKNNVVASDSYYVALDNTEIFDCLKSKRKFHVPSFYRDNDFSYLPREIKSSNAYEICKTIIKKKKFLVNVLSRIKKDDAINNTIEYILISQDGLNMVTRSDAINRAEIMKKYAEQSTNYNLTTRVICDYPFPGAVEVLKSLREKCDEDTQMYIDETLEILSDQRNN